MRYENEICPVCTNAFRSGDDIVVCPECGTPHHRECWNKNNCCGNSAHHAEGFLWQPEHVSQPADSHEFDPNRQLGRICPVCGTNCPPEMDVCPVCSNSFSNSSWAGQDGGRIPFMPPFEYNRGLFFDNLPCPPDTPVDSITARDMAVYIQVNSKRYISRFLRHKKLSWNWGAFFFGPFWYFFRKLYKAGIIAISVFLALSIIMSVAMGEKADTYYAGIQNIGDSSQLYSWSDEQLQEYMDLSVDLIKSFAPFLAANLLIRSAFALSADYLYRKKMQEDVTLIQSSVIDEREFNIQMIKKGGVSAMAGIASFIGYYIVFNLIMHFI